MIRSAACFVSLGLLVTSASVAAVPLSNFDPASQLIMLFDQNDAELPITAEEIVEGIVSLDNTSLGTGVKERFGRPISASLLIEARLPRERRVNLSLENADERLQRLVLVTYATPHAATQQLSRLSHDPGVLMAEPNRIYALSVAPTDPLYSPPFSLVPTPPADQWNWGLQKSLTGFQSAWDQTFGTAYVAVLDAGINEGHPDLAGRWPRSFAYRARDASTNVDEASSNFPNTASHGTHVAGIISSNTSLAFPPPGYMNPASSGGAGACWSCSLLVVNSVANLSSTIAVTASTLTSALSYASSTGAQVINMSLGTSEQISCATPPAAWSSMCTGLQMAADRDIVMVAATGNANVSQLNFPASDPRTIPVGAVRHDGTRWIGAQGDVAGGSNYGADMAYRGVVAPGVDVLSTVYPGKNWSSSGRCGDQTTAGSTADGDGYGLCTGTSMATPHVSGIVALMRTANPLASSFDIQLKLRQASSLGVNGASSQLGAGIPNAGAAVSNVLAITNNRLTPLFSLKKNGSSDRFFTVVPQMARAFEDDMLRPRPSSKTFDAGVPYGNLVYISGSTPYTAPGSTNQSRAQLWVYTTHVNPLNAAQPLVPLRRYVQCSGAAACVHSSTTVDHAYATSSADHSALTSSPLNYTYEGVEGYLLSPAYAQPASTEGIYTCRHTSNGDRAVTTHSEIGNMYALGYKDFVLAGYAYANNTGFRP